MTFVSHTNQQKRRSRLLRSKGLSYQEIGTRLGIAKSTAKAWSGDVPLLPRHRRRLYTKQVAMLSHGPRSSHERRTREITTIIEAARAEVPHPLDPITYKLFGAALYWAEGNKTQHFAVTNSDPELIKFMVWWVHTTLGISPGQIKAYLNIHDKQDERSVKNFWSQRTGIPITNFGKSFIKPMGKGYRHNQLYHGTIKLIVPRGTDLRHRVFGWVQAALHGLTTNADRPEQRWLRSR